MEDVFLPPEVQVRLHGFSSVPRSVAAQIRELWTRRNVCPEEEIQAIDDEMFKLVARYRRYRAAHSPRRRCSPLLDLAADMFPHRRTITRAGMADYLRAAKTAGVDLNANGYAPPSDSFDDRVESDLASAWSRACRGLTLISLVDRACDPGAPASANQSTIRYDEPGNVYPGFRVTLMFAPADLCDEPYDQIGQMRWYCRRMIVVR